MTNDYDSPFLSLSALSIFLFQLTIQFLFPKLLSSLSLYQQKGKTKRKAQQGALAEKEDSNNDTKKTRLERRTESDDAVSIS